MVVLLVLMFGCLMIAYVLFQARFLIGGPRITLTNQPTVVQTERLVTLTGSAFNITHLWLNDRAIFTDEQGYFSEDIILPSGYTIVTLRARDRYGRETRIEREFVYQPVQSNLIN